jgi:hypothetical protein
MMLWEIKEELCLYEGQKYRHTAVGNFVGYVYAKSLILVFYYHHIMNFTLLDTISNEDSFCPKILLFLSFERVQQQANQTACILAQTPLQKI